MTRALLLAAAGPVCLAAPLRAQCPDGTPPPCRRAASTPAPGPTSVAVLYLDILSRDSADAFLADGFTEEIITRLAQVSRIEVRSRFASRRFQGTRTDPQAIARALGVRHVLGGSVQPVGTRLRVRVELLRSGATRPVWTEVYDRPRADLATVLDEVARSVVGEIAGRLLPDERAQLPSRGSRDPAAFEDYLVGRTLLNRYTAVDLRGAVVRLQRAVERDPAFVEPWALLGVAWGVLWGDFGVPRAEALPRLREAAARGMALDSTYAPLVFARSAAAFYDADWVAAERLAREAFAAVPRDPMIRVLFAAVLAAVEKPDSAVLVIREAVALDSLSPLLRVSAFYRLYGAGRFTAADSQLTAFRALLPAGAPPPRPAVWLRVAQGRCDDARADAAAGNWELGRALAEACAGAGERAVRSAETLHPHGATALDVAFVCALAGRTDDAFLWLERALAERDPLLGFVRELRMLDPLRADPRWAAWLARLRASAGATR